MSRRRDEWIRRIRDVEQEGVVADIALESLRGELNRDSAFLTKQGLNRANFNDCTEYREATYAIRMFAVFENGLREARRAIQGHPTRAPVVALLNWFASRCAIESDLLVAAHTVRVLRNFHVHDGSELHEAVTLEQCRRHLCRFFSKLPESW